jgi:hypothetical protein
MAVAEAHNYQFDPDEFNFVAIRDRIRCYYKSFVQTARKRGQELPGKAHIKKHRPANSLDKYAEEKSKKALENQDGEKRGDDHSAVERDGEEKTSKDSTTVKGGDADTKAAVKTTETK